jgi:hypothetical protein
MAKTKPPPASVGEPEDLDGIVFQIAHNAYEDMVCRGESSKAFVEMGQQIHSYDLSYEYAEILFAYLTDLLEEYKRENVPYLDTYDHDPNNPIFKMVENHLWILRICAVSYIRERIKMEHEGAHIADVLLKIDRELHCAENTVFLRLALQAEKVEVEKEIERQLRSAKIRQELIILGEPKSERPSQGGTVPPAEEIIGQKGIKHTRDHLQTLDRTALFFHYLFNHAQVSGQNIGKAQVVNFLTAYSTESMEQKFSGSNVYGPEGDGKFLRDLHIVIGLFQKLGMTEVIALIRREHPEVNSID